MTENGANLRKTNGRGKGIRTPGPCLPKTVLRPEKREISSLFGMFHVEQAGNITVFSDGLTGDAPDLAV